MDDTNNGLMPRRARHSVELKSKLYFTVLTAALMQKTTNKQTKTITVRFLMLEFNLKIKRQPTFTLLYLGRLQIHCTLNVNLKRAK